MTVRILLIRHGQSANNALPEELRVCDPGLTQNGQRQAERLAESLAEAKIDSRLCSPIFRSLETVKPVAI
ncbi:MAG: histidine phosphatase family protein, partial [Planctomycetota bacterium]